MPKEKTTTNPWIKAKGTAAHVVACGAQKKGPFKVGHNVPLLSGLNEVEEPFIDDEDKKLASTKKTKKANKKSSKTTVISIEKE